MLNCEAYCHVEDCFLKMNDSWYSQGPSIVNENTPGGYVWIWLVDNKPIPVFGSIILRQSILWCISTRAMPSK